jgi:Spy/CpxP family protein refolding chaperone
MKKNILIGMVAILASALLASAAMAWGPGYGRGWGQGPGYGYAALPNLTPEQSSRIQTIQQANIKEMTPLQEQLFAKKTELRNLWLSQNPDRAQVNALQKDVLNIRSLLQEKATNATFEVRKVLTPEQQAQLAAYGPGMGHGMMGGRMGRW